MQTAISWCACCVIQHGTGDWTDADGTAGLIDRMEASIAEFPFLIRWFQWCDHRPRTDCDTGFESAARADLNGNFLLDNSAMLVMSIADVGKDSTEGQTDVEDPLIQYEESTLQRPF